MSIQRHFWAVVLPGIAVLTVIIIPAIYATISQKAADRDASASEPFVFVGVYGAGVPGRMGVDRFVYVSGAGHAQSYSVRDEAVVGMQESEVTVDPLMKEVERSLPGLPRAFAHRGDGLQSMDALIPSYVRIALRLVSGQIYDWAGYETELSPAQRDLVQRIQEIAQHGRVLENEKPSAYVAAYWLDDQTASQFRREGLLQTVAPEVSSAMSPIHESLRYPFRLIPVRSGTNPFQGFHRSFEPGRDVLDAEYLGTAFQVRSYAIGASP